MIDIFSEVIKMLKKNQSDNIKVGLVIVGDGSQKYTLRSKIQKLKLEDNIKIVGWVEKPWKYYEHADLYIQTSKYEGFGMSLLEAGYVGLPIVSTDVGLVGEVLKPGESVVVINKNKSEVVNKITNLIYNESIRRSLGNKAQKNVVQYMLSKEEYLERFQNMFKI